ncbi:zinc finger RNA-binding protein-like [Oryza brachyantha]|uniref:U1-type domain-containing protein n=1 Tax=Oryza brachyantha TaxID=4533 RepID=J3N1Q6_ORYBR|nr:zinc finger RNA-binding protein-like [Oryza brachyantha]
MDYAAAASHAAAPPPPPPADPHHHPHYPHPYAAYPYPYAAYHPTAPASDPSSAASSSYYYPNAVSTAAAGSAPPYDHYAAYQYYGAPAAAGAGSGASGGLSGYYFGAGEAFQAQSSSASQGAPGGTAAAAKEAGKHFGFDPQRYAQAAASRVTNGMAPPVTVLGMHHAQWNAQFGHPVPKTVSRKHIKKKPKVVQPLTCEVCKIQCDTPDVLRIHKTGKKHKKNLERLQDSITPKAVKPPNTATPSAAPAAITTTPSVLPAVQTKKKKSSAATPEELEFKKRRVLEAGAAQGEVKICTVCNVVVNSQKVYEFHIAGQKHQAMAQKQQAQQQIA